MVTVIGVRFRCAAKLYYFDPVGEIYERGDHVIVETARGREMGSVSIPNREVDESEVVLPLKPVLRRATEEDMAIKQDNIEREKEAARICREKIAANNLEMKLVEVEYTFDENKIIFYFTADGRVDFRELVKDLASVFRTRIELRQIGVRDETKIKGGIGICGRPLCCSSYLTDFVPVSIKMAKEQSLSLNPTKISGVCGRLMCCLKYEEDTYEYLNSRLPIVGDTVIHKGDGVRGTVQTVNVLRQTVKILISEENDNVELKEYPMEELNFRCRRHDYTDGGDIDPEAEEGLEELESLEEKEEAIERQAAADLGDAVVKSERRGDRRRGEGRKHSRDGQGGREGRTAHSEREDRGDRENRREREDRRSRENHGSQDASGEGAGERRPEEHRDNRNRGRDRRPDYRKERKPGGPRPERTGHGDRPERPEGGSRPETGDDSCQRSGEETGRGDRKNNRYRKNHNGSKSGFKGRKEGTPENDG